MKSILFCYLVTAKHYKSFLLLILISLFSGCASNGTEPDPNDPFESYNRAMFTFNDNVDQYLLKPVAKGYDFITPSFMQKGVSNFFSNLDDVIVLVNDLFQFKFAQAASDTGRILINSTFGLLGLIDWASDIGLEKHNEDFGQTLGYWGVPSGPYFVLPFLGPSTIRDTTGLATDSTYFDPIYKELHEEFPPPSRENEQAVWGMTGLKAIDTRANLLKTEKIVDEAALDRYIFIREGFLQRRENLVYDGNPPVDDQFDESDLFKD
ncbi:MAG: VacJ family lipoprotein [Gammaproteobacteria bacterium]|nr:VacJ family lipoprotein [Gammaproteobacteria bacterium]